MQIATGGFRTDSGLNGALNPSTWFAADAARSWIYCRATVRNVSERNQLSRTGCGLRLWDGPARSHFRLLF